MSSINNSKAIIRNWKSLWHKTKASVFGQYVEEATGDYPDATGYTSPSNEQEGTEDEMILDSITNPNHNY